MNKVEEALAYHKQGYNCAQAVACVFAEELGIEEKEIFRMSEGFGFGMGTMGTCGAVSGMAIVAGLLNSDGNLKQPRSKPQTYKVTVPIDGVVWHLDVGSSHPGAEAGPKGWSVRPLKRYVSWV